MENMCLISLVEKVKEKDMSSFPLIFSEFEKLIKIYAFRFGGDDTVQDLTVFLIELLYKIDLSIFERDESDSLKRYIAVSIRNRYIYLSRQNAKFQFESEISYLDDRPSKISLSDRYFLKEALSRLSDKQKEIVVYKYIYSYSDAEIADFLKVTRQAVNRLKNRAIGILKEFYSEGA